MIRREGQCIVLSGAVTLANVASVAEEGRRHLAEGVQTVDVGEVSEMDFSLLAMLLAWLREARSQERELRFANLPEALQTLARLYGVEGLLPPAPSQR